MLYASTAMHTAPIAVTNLANAPITRRALSLSLDAAAQTGTGRVTGRVVEARTGAPLIAVLVKVQSTKQQAFSDRDGRFEIADVPAGPQTLLVSVVGFGLVRRDVTLVSGKRWTSPSGGGRREHLR